MVFVWTEHGELAHATVTVGAGWMLTKPSQSWSSPRMIWRSENRSTPDAIPTHAYLGTDFADSAPPCARGHGSPSG